MTPASGECWDWAMSNRWSKLSLNQRFCLSKGISDREIVLFNMQSQCYVCWNVRISERLLHTWKLCSKQDPSSSIAGGVRTELVGQQRDGAEGKSLGDADGGGEADHACSHHANPDASHPGQAGDSTWRTEPCQTLLDNLCNEKVNPQLRASTSEITARSKDQWDKAWFNN